MDDYVDRMVGESLFDHDMGEEEEEEVKEEEKEEVKEEEVKEEVREEVKEVSLDDLLV